jgi:hypothetical protein
MIPQAEQGETARQIAERQNLREWVEAILNEQIAELDLEAAPHVIDQLTEVVECRAKEIATADLARLRAEGEALRQKGERVFEAVVYAFEGRPIPDDLREHGMVRRALKYRAAREAEGEALRGALRKFGGHDKVRGCPVLAMPPGVVLDKRLYPCTCGFEAALAAPRAEDGTGR